MAELIYLWKKKQGAFLIEEFRWGFFILGTFKKGNELMKKGLLVSLFSIAFCATSFAALQSELDTVVVTATRIKQNNYKLAGNVTVITREQIESSNARTIPDILVEALGVNVYNSSTAKSSTVDIRGFGDTAARNILVMIDGRKINPVDISAPDLIQTPLESVERIEIIRGAGSVLYGDNAVGGVVNILTKQGEGDFSARVGTTYGSYDAQSVDLEFSGEEKDVSYYVYSKYNDQRGYRDNSDLLAKDFNTRLGYDFHDRLSVDFSAGYHKDVQELPGGLTDSQLATLGRKGSGNQNDISYTTDRYVKIGLDVDPWPEGWEFGRIVIDTHYRNRDVYDEFNAFSAFHTKREIDSSGVSAKYVFDHTIFEKEVNFVVGFDFIDTENLITGSGTNVDDITISKAEWGFFGSLQYELLKDLFVNAGTRYYQAEYAFSQRNVAVDEKQRPDEWVSMAGVKYDYAKGSNVHFNAQQTFRFLATDEWYSTANFPGFGITPGLQLGLEQQTGIQYEAGIKHNFDDKVIVTVTPYWIELKNEIFFDPVTFGNANYDKTRRIGVEIGQKVDVLEFLDLEFFDKIEFFSNYTFQNPEFVNGVSDGKDIPMAAQHQASSGLIIGLFDHYNFSLVGNYVGARYAINDTLNATPKIKPHYVLDAKVAYKAKNFELFGAINNLTNEEYETFVVKSTFSSTKSHFPNDKRNYTVGMSLKF